MAEEVLTAGCSRWDRLLEKCQYFPRNVELAGVRDTGGTQEDVSQGHTCLPWQWCFQTLCRLRGAQGERSHGTSPRPCHCSLPWEGHFAFPFPSSLPVHGCYKGTLVPRDQGQAFAREGGTRQAGDQRERSCTDPSRPSAIPLGKQDTPWEGGFAPNLSTWVMCWRPEPKSDPNPSVPHHGGRGVLTQIRT